MALHRRLPTEIVLMVLEDVAAWDRSSFRVAHTDLLNLMDSPRRNATLAACAVVCKAWTRPSQLVLYRDIRIAPDWEDEPPNTVGLLDLLYETLSTRQYLASYIQAFQAGVGYDHYRHVRYGSFETLALILCCCQNLCHLGLTLWPEIDSSTYTIPRVDTAPLCTLTNIRHVHISIHDSDSSVPVPRMAQAAMYHLLATWPTLEAASFDSVDGIPSSLEDLSKLFDASHLQQIHFLGDSDMFAGHLVQSARNLTLAYIWLPDGKTVLELPPTLRHLVLQEFLEEEEYDISHLTSLRSFAMGSAEWSFEFATDLFRLLSPTVQALAFPAAVLSSSSTFEGFAESVEHVTGLKQVTLYVGDFERAPRDRTMNKLRRVLRQHLSREVSVVIQVSLDTSTWRCARPNRRRRTSLTGGEYNVSFLVRRPQRRSIRQAHLLSSPTWMYNCMPVAMSSLGGPRSTPSLPRPHISLPTEVSLSEDCKFDDAALIARYHILAPG